MRITKENVSDAKKTQHTHSGTTKPHRDDHHYRKGNQPRHGEVHTTPTQGTSVNSSGKEDAAAKANS